MFPKKIVCIIRKIEDFPNVTENILSLGNKNPDRPPLVTAPENDSKQLEFRKKN